MKVTKPVASPVTIVPPIAILVICIPFVLSSVNISHSPIPFGVDTISTALIAWVAWLSLACKEPLFTISFDSESTITNVGGVR